MSQCFNQIQFLGRGISWDSVISLGVCLCMYSYAKHLGSFNECLVGWVELWEAGHQGDKSLEVWYAGIMAREGSGVPHQLHMGFLGVISMR